MRGLGLQGTGQLQLIFNLKPELPSPPGLVDQYTITIDGRRLEYQMGFPREKSFSWPGNEGAAGARLEISTRDGFYIPKEFAGRWGWFRLLQLAHVERESSSNFRVSWYFSSSNAPEITVRFLLGSESIYNPFGRPNFFQLDLPNRLF
jgi:type VI secretion system protein ImpL